MVHVCRPSSGPLCLLFYIISHQGRETSLFSFLGSQEAENPAAVTCPRGQRMRLLRAGAGVPAACAEQSKAHALILPHMRPSPQSPVCIKLVLKLGGLMATHVTRTGVNFQCVPRESDGW